MENAPCPFRNLCSVGSSACTFKDVLAFCDPVGLGSFLSFGQCTFCLKEERLLKINEHSFACLDCWLFVILLRQTIQLFACLDSSDELKWEDPVPVIRQRLSIAMAKSL